MTVRARQDANGQFHTDGDHVMGGQPPTALASLEHTVAVQLVNIGRTGCLLESPFALEPGSICMLQVTVEHDTYEDLVRIVRTQPLAGRGSVHYLGVMFVCNDAPGVRSLRRLAHDLRTGTIREATIGPLRGELNT